MAPVYPTRGIAFEECSTPFQRDSPTPAARGRLFGAPRLGMTGGRHRHCHSEPPTNPLSFRAAASLLVIPRSLLSLVIPRSLLSLVIPRSVLPLSFRGASATKNPFAFAHEGFFAALALRWRCAQNDTGVHSEPPPLSFRGASLPVILRSVPPCHSEERRRRRIP